MRIFHSFRRSIATISLIAMVSQIVFPAFTFAADPTLTASLTQANRVPEAQIVTLTVPQDINPGDTLSFTLSGNTVVQSFDTSSDVTLGLLNVKIDSLLEVTSSVDLSTRTYTVTSATPGVGFTTPTLVLQAAARDFTTLVNNVVAVAQEAEFLISANLITGDVIGVTVAGTGIIQNFDTNKATTLTNLATQITNNTVVQATYSGSTGKVHLIAKVPGNAFSLSNIVTQSSNVTSSVVQPNVVPVAQVNTISLPRTIDVGETLHLTISGSGVIQSYSGSSTETVDAFVNQIDSLDLVNATVTGSTITITAATPGIPFVLGALSVTGGSAVLVPVQPNIEAIAQVDVLSFARDFVMGDTISGSLDGSALSVTYSGSSADTLAQLAADIDALDSVTATSNSALKTITITAQNIGIPFSTGNFALRTQLANTLVSGNISAKAQSESITFPRPLIVGDEVSVVVNGSTVTQSYSGSSDETITAFAAALNSGGISASPSLTTRTITLSADVPGVSFTVSTLQVLNQGSPTILQNPIVPVKQVVKYTIPNTLITGDSITGTIGGLVINLPFAWDDTGTLATLTSQIDGQISVDATFDTPTRTLTVTAGTAGVSFDFTDLQITGSGATASNIAANQTEIRANLDISLVSVPNEGEAISVGNCTITFMSGANDYDCSNNNASVEINSGNIDNVAALLRGITGLSDAVNGALATTGSSTGVTYTRSTSQSGTIAISLSGSSSFAMTANIPQEAAVQSDSYTVPRTLVDGDTLKVTIDGTTYSQTFLNNSNATIANLAGNIDNLPYLGATASGNTITITSTTAGNAYTTGNLTITHASLANQTISNTVGNTAVQSIAFGADFVTGDIVEVTVNGTLTSTPYATSSIATIGSVATAISTVSGVSATASGSNEIIVTATQTGANLAINQTQVKNSSSSTVIQSNEVAVAQSDSYTLPYPLVSGTTVSGDINGTPVSQAFTTDENDTLTLLAGKLETAGPVNASFSGGNQTLTLLAKTPGTGYSSSLRISGESVTPENKVLNTDSGAQVENYSFSRNLVDGEVLQVTVDGSGITQNFITDTPTTLTALATQINDLSGVNAALAGSTIIVTAAIAGIPFIAGTLTIDMGVTGIPVTANRPAQQQIEKFTAARNLVAGDVITATVNDMTLTTSYSGSEAETLAKLASDIDALSGVTATAAWLDITVSAEVAGIPFTVGSMTLVNTITETITVTNVSAVAQVDALNLPSFYAGDIVSLSLDGTPLNIPFRNDTSTTIADIQSAIDTVGPVSTSLSGGQLIVTAKIPGTPFTLSSLGVTNTQGSTIIAVNVPAVMQIVDISANNVIKKWTFQVTVNGTPFNYLSNGSDDSTTIATQLANVMTASGVTATASGTQLRLTADVPGVEFTYSATATDLTAPAITNVVNASETLKSGAVTTTSLSIDEPGNIYFVLSGSVANTTGDINTLLLAGHAFLGQAGATTDTPYTFTVPAGISDGSYGAVAVDTFNNVSGYHVTGLVVDNTPPVVTIVTASGQTVSTATFVVSGTTEPLLGVTISTASGSTSISAIGNGDFSGSVALNLNAPNTVTVTATDVAGNVGSSTIQVTQDSINPLFTFSPSATITNQTSITFNGSTEANVDVGIIGGLAPVHVISGNDGSFSGTLNLNRNTMNTLDVTTTDLANNTSTGSFTVTQDDILPTVAIATASGSVVDSATFQIDGSTEMNTSVTVYNQSGSVVGTNVASGTGAFSVSATLLQDATNVLTVTATDAAGNQSSDAVSVIEDSMSNTIVIMPVLPTATNAASINVAGNTKANSSLSLVHSGGLTQTGTTADGTFTFPVTLLANTTNDITLTSQDLAGHVATGSVSIVHDSIAPVVTLGGVDLTTSLTSYTMTGTTEPLASLVITGGSGANVGGTADGSGSFSIAVPLQIGAVNALVLTATDLAGNSGTGGVNITQDPVPLTLVLNPIGTVITNATTFTISGTSKANADIAITGSGSANTVASSTGTFSVTVNLVNDGLNTFLVTASDAAGAQLTDTFSVTQDSIAPVLGLANSTGATAQLSYVLNGTTESGATVHANVVGTGAFTGTISSIGTASGTFSMTIPLLANTGGTFDIIAMDTAGNMSTGATLSVLQDNLAPAIGTQSFSGSTTGGVSIGYYQFTTNEVTDSTFYVGTGSNVLTSLIWTGATNGLNHSGTIVGIQAGVSYYTFVRAIDALGNTTDSAVAPVLFAAAGTTGGSMGGSTGGSSGGSSGGSTGGSTGGSSGGYGPLIISYPSGGNVTSSTSTGTTVTTQSGATQTGTTTGVKKPVTTVKKPGTIIKKPTTIVTKPTTPTKKPTSVTKPTVKPTPVKPWVTKPVSTGKTVITTTSTLTKPPKGFVVQGPGFDYAIVDKNFVSPTGSSENNGISLFQPGVRFISAANSVKIRTTRNPQSNLVDILPRNSRVILVEEKDGWGKIEVNGSTGWVGLEYLRSLQDSDLARVDVRIFEVGYAPDYVIYYARTSAYALNFRAGPNGDYRTIRYLPQGERIVVLDSVGYGWVEIRTVSGNGFVQRKWLKDE